MATTIKETPILTGKDARVFLERVNNPKKASTKEKQRILSNYMELKKIENN